ncbi:MAG: hypothetical protein SNG38_02195 [Rikenellaceae bacterium]
MIKFFIVIFTLPFYLIKAVFCLVASFFVAVIGALGVVVGAEDMSDVEDRISDIWRDF